MRVLGVDPAREIARKATEAGVPTINAFMDTKTAEVIAREGGPVHLCTANNVFAHNDDLGVVAEAIAAVLADEGVFVFEVSYLLNTVEGLVFDFIYHEHLCYHSVKPMNAFLQRHGMQLFDVERTSSKGGSLRGYAQRNAGSRPVSPRVAEFIDCEESAGLYNPLTYQRYLNQIDALRDMTSSCLARHQVAGAKVAGYGDSATVTTLIHHFRIGDDIDFLVDDNATSPWYRLAGLSYSSLPSCGFV